jgi:predicted HAD superfamily Cof-like phosphohydrolase
MSTIVEDIEQLTTTFEFDKEPLDLRKLYFRGQLLQEEINEYLDAVYFRQDDDVVDALIDLTVVALGTLAILKVDIQKAWDEVHRANMSKQRGIKPGRENSGGFDLIKPQGWTAPYHEDNVGRLKDFFINHPTPGRESTS